MTEQAQTDVSDRTPCPKCQATVTTTGTLTDRFVYLRCESCYEVWAIPERRTHPRHRQPLQPETPANGSPS